MSEVDGPGVARLSDDAAGSASRVFAAALHGARSLPDGDDRVHALLDVAGWLAASGFGDAVAVCGEAEAQARAYAVDDPGWVAQALIEQVAVAWARHDPARAVALAREVDNSPHRVWSLIRVARALASSDPDCAWAVVDEALVLARSLGHDDRLPVALAEIALIVQWSDPEWACRLFAEAEAGAWALTDVTRQVEVLAAVIVRLAPADPVWAERLARDLPDEGVDVLPHLGKPGALAEIAPHLVPLGAERAESIVWMIGRRGEDRERVLAERETAVAAVALRLTGADGQAAVGRAEALRAEELVRGIGYWFTREQAMADLAGRLALGDPRRAERLAMDIIDPGWRAKAIIRVARQRPDPDRRRLLGVAQHAALLAAVDPSPAHGGTPGSVTAVEPDGATGVVRSGGPTGIAGRSWAEVSTMGTGRARSPQPADPQPLILLADCLADTDGARAVSLLNAAERAVGRMAVERDRPGMLAQIGSVWAHLA